MDENQLKCYLNWLQSTQRISKKPSGRTYHSVSCTNISEGQRVVIIDDLVATGGTAIACAELLTENFNVQKSDILILCIIDLPNLGGSKLIVKDGYNIETLVSY